MGAMGISQVAFLGSSMFGMPGGLGVATPTVVLVVLMGVFSITLSALCINCGLHMYRGTSRNWTITEAVCCCLTPMWWPFGLILGIGVVVYTLTFDSSETAPVGNKPAASSDAPRLCIMGLVAFCIHVVSVFVLFIFLFAVLYYITPVAPVSTPPHDVLRIER